jgi:hypothetical protein
MEAERMNRMKICVPILLIALLNAITASAGKLEPILVAPADSPQAGQKIVFSVFLHN